MPAAQDELEILRAARTGYDAIEVRRGGDDEGQRC